MTGGPPALGPVADQADAARAAVAVALAPGTVLGIYLYGSAMAGGLRPGSDLDLFGVIGRPLTDTERSALVAGLLPISWRAQRPAGWRPLEVTLVVANEVRPWRFPPRFDFQYGDWLREELLAGGGHAPIGPHPDVALQVRMVLDHGYPLLGPPPVELLEAPPHGDVVRAMLDGLPSLLADLETDTRNVLLTLARMWVTVAPGHLRPKDAAADWAMERLPGAHRDIRVRARDGYLHGGEETWEPAQARAVADALVSRITGTSAYLSARDA